MGGCGGGGHLEPEGAEGKQPERLRETHPGTALGCGQDPWGLEMNGKGGLQEGRVCVQRRKGGSRNQQE